jgi:tRNA 2-thiouridine synthesizing protein D
MHFVISGTWGPTDPTRAMLPFIFAASAVQDGDSVTLMLFHDAVLMAVDGAGAKLVPVGPPNRYEEVASHPNVIVWACRLASMLAALPLLLSIIGSSSAG